MALRETFEELGGTHAVDFDWARRKFRDHYHRYVSNPEVGQRYGQLCVELAGQLHQHGSAVMEDADADEVIGLLEGVLTGRLGPSGVRELSGIGMELPIALHRLECGGFHERYEGLIAELGHQNEYRPNYIAMGPTGRCNVQCPDCIIGGAIFKKHRQTLRIFEDIRPYLQQAEEHGLSSISLCIGEPTWSMPLLGETLDFVRQSPGLRLRSLVTNALFARSPERARYFLNELRARLGDQKARECVLGISLNPDLISVGVPVRATANLIEAFGQVFPNHRLVIQLILDEGFHKPQNALFSELGRRGLLPGHLDLRLPVEGCHARIDLSDGTRMLTSVMLKQPSLHNPWARAGAMEGSTDPWVRYFTRDALEHLALKGLYTYEGGEDADEADTGLIVHRITLGPDGLLYPDYHFMVAGARPLGRSMGEAIDSFRRDPILSLLLQRGGANVLLATYMSIPPEERLIADLYEPALSCSTTGMLAANVLFGDYEVAGQLAVRLLTCGPTLPEAVSRTGP